MKHPCIRWISLLLCTCLMLTALPAGASPMDEQYRQRVFTRYDASFEESSYYENLLNSRAYLYEQWAANMEELPAAAEALTKPAELMLDKKLDAEAYTEYLLRLMAMVERGFTDTIASQASYTATLSGWDGVKGTTTIVGKLLPGGKTLSRISKALDGYGNAYDIYALVDEVVADEQQLALVSVSSALYQEKCMVLEAIIAHTDDQLLKEAAEANKAKLDAASVTIKAKAGAGGRLFGSVTSKEIAAEIKNTLKLDIDKKKIVLDSDIKAFGTYTVPVKLYTGISANLKVIVTE